MSGSLPTDSSGRRRFLKLLGFAGLSSAIGSALGAMAQTRPGAPSASPAAPDTTHAKAPSDSLKAAEKPPELSEDARDLAAIVRRRYGQHLKPEQLEAVTQELDNRVQGGKRLRGAKLRNSDEPDFTFHA